MDVKPHASAPCQVEEAGRERQWRGHVFSYGRMVEEVTTFSDSDWAGCKETRTSSSAGVIQSGSHTLEACTCKQKIIARSSAEAGLDAAALGASESRGTLSLLKDLGYEMKPVLAIDAKATEHILHWQGIGKLKHIDVAYLRMQGDVRSKRLRVRRVMSEENVAGLGTKPLSKAVVANHCLALGYVDMTEENAQCELQDVAMSRDFNSAFSSQQQPAGDHVQTAASSSIICSTHCSNETSPKNASGVRRGVGRSSFWASRRRLCGRTRFL